MEPLDLSKAPPRDPRQELDGLPNLPRTIDKMRAHLPGGNPGPYKIEGLSSLMLDVIGISQEQFRDFVARASSDEEVAKWLRTAANTAAYPEFAKDLLTRTVDSVRCRDPKGLAERYPLSEERPDITYVVDLLAADDKAMFPNRA